MTDKETKPKESIFKGVDLNIETNNSDHHTDEISLTELIVRRGKSFNVDLNLTKPFNQKYPLTITAKTGPLPSQEIGTESQFGIPDVTTRSPNAKAVWKVAPHKDSSTKTGALILTITPPADAPIGRYRLSVKHRSEETVLAELSMLFNPWCSEDMVYMEDENERLEYVMNEDGMVYRGSANYIFPLHWHFGQFEDDMVEICFKILDRNLKHRADPADDVSARCNSIYVGRVISAMINSPDDSGVLMGRWGGSYADGEKPTHWSGSHPILKKWFENGCKPVRYGQCWVFAAVMCSVMRLLGIPCRVVTNFASAHDTNQNLIIDNHYWEDGVEEKDSPDSIWNFHVWTEAWMKRPDLGEDGKYDGWQVLDPTPQELSEGTYCCGPTSVKAILNGETALKYDCPFVFAEVNADCVDWLHKADGTTEILYADHKRVGQKISTKALPNTGFHYQDRADITHTYKHKEGSDEERDVFRYAITRDYSNVDEDTGGVTGGAAACMAMSPLIMAPERPVIRLAEVERPPVLMHFEEVTPPTNGKDVTLNLVLESKSSVARQLSIDITVQAMKYNGTPAAKIQHEVKDKTLEPGEELTLPILVTFDDYHKHMIDCDSMKISALVKDKESKKAYLEEDDVVLLDPPMEVKILDEPQWHRMVKGEVVFMNPTVNETLTECTMTLSGSGLWKDELQFPIGDIRPNRRIRVNFTFNPYKTGKKTIVADFDCCTFRDIKASCVVDVKASDCSQRK